MERVPMNVGILAPTRRAQPVELTERQSPSFRGGCRLLFADAQTLVDGFGCGLMVI
jgi:hypothetical protein